MIVKLAVSPDQIRWHAQSALNGFDTLEGVDATENAKSELQALLDYLTLLDAADEAPWVAPPVGGGP